jgi:membrane-associated phospholipid phosphatase
LRFQPISNLINFWLHHVHPRIASLIAAIGIFGLATSLIYTVATILITAIGLSRLDLGVHWPTDIIAGYGVGFLWLMTCITMFRLRQI